MKFEPCVDVSFIAPKPQRVLKILGFMVYSTDLSVELVPVDLEMPVVTRRNTLI